MNELLESRHHLLQRSLIRDGSGVYIAQKPPHGAHRLQEIPRMWLSPGQGCSDFWQLLPCSLPFWLNKALGCDEAH